MNKNKKNLHKVTANVLGITLASVMAAGAAAQAQSPVTVFAAEQTQNKKAAEVKKIYLNGAAAALAEEADGSTEKKAVNSLEKALKLAGNSGTIAVCGTVTISTEKKLAIPSGVTVKRSEGFKGPLIKITGEGKLLLSGGQLEADDVDVSAAKAGEQAFQLKSKKELQKAPEPAMPAEIVLNSPEEWISYDFSASGFSKDGVFAWEKQTAPSEYQSSVKIIFTPLEVEKYDYSGIEGWNPESGTVVRTVNVTITSLKPEEENQETTKKASADVKIPQELSFKTKAEWAECDFAARGFLGDGIFAWETNAALTAYESQVNVVFVPADAEKYDYAKTEGWNAETGVVVRSIRIITEELKTSEDKKEPEGDREPEDNKKPEGDKKPEDNKKPEEDKKPEDNKKPEGDKKPEDNKKPEGDKKPEDNKKPEEDKKPEEENKDNSAGNKIEHIEDIASDTEQEKPKEETVYPETGKNAEVAEEAPEAIPVGSLIDESGVQVFGDFLPFYVDLRVSYNEAVNELPDAGIGELLSAYELGLWDLKEDKAYEIPEGKKVKVMLPLPENAGEFSDLSIAHYLGNNQYEYFVFEKDGKSGNMNIEVKDGKQYLVFETSSFSPFNVGGHQIVGPGTISSGHKPAAGGDTKPSTDTASKGGSSTGAQKNPSVSTNNKTQNQKPNPVQTVKKDNGIRIINTVRTGDENIKHIILYTAAGIAAVLLAVVTFIQGKKKK